MADADASRRVILHIGTHRTGTTSIQRFLADHREGALRDGGYRYPVGMLQEEIERYTEGKSPDAYLFPSQKGTNPITTTQAYRILNDAADFLGRDDIGTHTMRKTFGYHHYKRFKDVAILQEIFNHSAPSITKRYIGIRQDEINESLNDFRLG